MAFVLSLQALLCSAYVLGGLQTSHGLIAVSSDHFGRSCPHFFVAEAVLVFMSVGGGSDMNQQLPALWGRDEE